MTNFYTDTIQADSRFGSTDAISDVALLEPSFRAKMQTFIELAAQRGVTLKITETYRSSQRQQKLFSEGKTQLQTVGVHHYGLACDFCKIVNGAASWDGDWTFMAEIAAQLNEANDECVSGIDWGMPDQPHSFVDSDHVQGCTVAQQATLFAGTWYPRAGAGGGTGGVAPVPAAAGAAGTPPEPAGLTAAQQVALAAFDKVNARSYNNWFNRSTAFAFIETESAFKPDAFRQEPSGVASYGLMQVLDSTAAGLGLTGDASQMNDPETGIFYGLKYLAQGWNYLQTHFGRPPTMPEWMAGYNEGYGAAAQGRPDPNYVATCSTNRAKWLYLDG